jgi:hypothetical protein
MAARDADKPVKRPLTPGQRAAQARKAGAVSRKKPTTFNADGSLPKKH